MPDRKEQIGCPLDNKSILNRLFPGEDDWEEALEVAGGLYGLVTASPERLTEWGCNLDLIEKTGLLRELMGRILESRIENSSIIASWREVMDYCRLKLGGRSTEALAVLFLDQKNHLIADRILAEGTVDQVPFFSREILKSAILLDAGALLLVHNHPSGDEKPSQLDIERTQDLNTICQALDIRLHDHVVVSRNGYKSMRSMGAL